MTSDDRDGQGGVDRRRAWRELAAFFAGAFVITWGLGALLLLARPQLEAVIGPLGAINHHWLYYLAVCAPSLSAVGCSLAFGGWAGLKTLALRFVRPTRPIWLLIAVLAWPAAFTAYALAARAMGAASQINLHALAVGAPLLALTTPILITDPGGLGEETGWRGFALPRLLMLFRPATAAVVLGVIWGVWHLPAFFVSGLAQSQFGFGWFLLATVASSILMTWIYVHANGNLLAAGVIPHLMFNLPFDAHVFSGDVIRLEATVMGLLAAGLLIGSGPSLRGWRPRP